MVFWVRVVVKAAISCFSEPVITCLQLIVEVFVVIFFGRFIYEFFGICALRPQGEISSSMFVCWLHIMVVTFVARELRRVGTKNGSWSFAVEKIFGMRSTNFVSIFSFVAISIDRVDIKMISFKFVILFIMVDLVWDELLPIVASLID